MKVHIYVHPSDVILLSGLIGPDAPLDVSGIHINYSGIATQNTVMVSMSINEFVYLQDQGVLDSQELIFN
jgi:hypothetical protein